MAKPKTVQKAKPKPTLTSRPKPRSSAPSRSQQAAPAAKPARTPTKPAGARSTKLSAKPSAKLPLVAVKPAKASAPSQPLPPAPPAPAPHRDEMIAPRDIARLLRYGEHFGPHKIDIRMLQTPLPVASTAIAICDPTTAKSWRVFDRPVTGGAFRVMLSVARTGAQERLAAVVVHVGRPPIAKWTVAHYQGQQKPKAPDQLARATSAGWLALLDA
ncbi:MAG: DUF4241 domain-containing protein, partial [Deltaproteobacteria bacterium]|nr:DUF4241 domain-containing protein [Deltaproteobacteria bacterium]